MLYRYFEIISWKKKMCWEEDVSILLGLLAKGC